MMKVYMPLCFFVICHLLVVSAIALYLQSENVEYYKEMQKKDAIISQILNEDYVKIDGVHKRFHICKVTDECCAN